MLVNVYALFDVKSESYSLPYFAVSDAVAVRTAYDAYIMADCTVSRHPEDYTLFRLGLFDDTRGVISGSERVFVVDMLSLVSKSGGDDIE